MPKKSKKSKGVKPPIELFVVVNEVADDHVCASSLDKLHGQERFESDKVYRVLLVEEVEDPRPMVDRSRRRAY